MTVKKPDRIVEILEQAGYEAYFVGGCVRDQLLGRPVHDWDITTSALPEQIMACFPHCIPTGLQHGTVTVLEDQTQAEVTTFRCDGGYTDGRHPEQVTFVRSLREDLARRDFTVNAMAMDQNDTVTDLYGGREDLRLGIIRCVGDPDRRFQEDALRMLRALRFAAQLGFAIEAQTLTAIQANSSLCAKLSVERIRDELEKTLLSDRPGFAGQMIRLGLLLRFGLTEDRGLSALADLPQERAVRWAGFCRLYPELDLMLLRLDKKTAHTAMVAAALPCPHDRLAWKRMIASHGAEVARIVAALWNRSVEAEAVLACGECMRIKELAVSGRDLPFLQGAAVGQCLNRLLEHVLQNPEDNVRDTLLQLAVRLYR